jgi:Flp pilus assembly pilin Flp
MRHRAAVLSEYGLVVALVAVVAIGILTTFGTTIVEIFETFIEQLSEVTKP